MALSIVGKWVSPYQDVFYEFFGDGTYRYIDDTGKDYTEQYSISGDQYSGYNLISSLPGGKTLTWGVALKHDGLYLDARIGGFGAIKYEKAYGVPPELR